MSDPHFQPPHPSPSARFSAVPRVATAWLGRALLWLLLAVAFGMVEALVHVTEWPARLGARGASSRRSAEPPP